MNNPTMRDFPSRAELDAHLADAAVDRLQNAIDARGQATLVVSGGSTPLNFFAELSRRELDWGKVVITLADERWVDADHPDSNQKLVAEHLLVNCAAAARFIALKNAEANARAGEFACEKALSSLGTFDLVILGMGGDGHTASLFPGAEALSQGLAPDSGRTCIAVQPLEAPHQRMSMTLPRLLDAHQVVVHITGEDKRAVLSQALQLEDLSVLPVSAVLRQQRTPVSVFWAP